MKVNKISKKSKSFREKQMGLIKLSKDQMLRKMNFRRLLRGNRSRSKLLKVRRERKLMNGLKRLKACRVSQQRKGTRLSL